LNQIKEFKETAEAGLNDEFAKVIYEVDKYNGLLTTMIQT